MSNLDTYSWAVWAHGDVHYQVIVAEIANLQLNPGMKIAIGVPGY